MGGCESGRFGVCAIGKGNILNSAIIFRFFIDDKCMHIHVKYACTYTPVPIWAQGDFVPFEIIPYSVFDLGGESNPRANKDKKTPVHYGT